MRRLWWAGVAIVAVSAGAIYFARTRTSASPSAASATYVDPATCSGCHPNTWETYRRTGMGRSFHKPTRALTQGDSNKPVVFYHQASDSYFTMEERGGRFYQGRYQIGFDGKKTNLLEKEIAYVVGSGNHVRAYLSRASQDTSNDTLVELPLAWYAEKGGYWAMNPAYDRPDHPGFSRTVTNGCMFCHNAYPEPAPGRNEPGAEPRFPGSLSEGIDCQRCHGPGSRHVRMAESADSKPEEIRKSIVNPSRLTADRQMEVCMQCHLETTSLPLPDAIVRYDRDPFSYQPGQPLADFMLHFDHAPASGREDKFEIASAASRLRRSECFLKSGGKLSCTTCHNPHDIPRGEPAAQHYTQVCRTCHATALSQLVSSDKHSSSEDCIGCHMPKRRTDDVVHAVMTDHYIQRRRPAHDLLAEMPERHETEETAFRGEVVPYYPSPLPQGSDNELYLAVAQVSQKSNLSRGIPLLAAAIAKYRPERIEFILHLGDAFMSSGQEAQALPQFEEAARRRPDSPIALQRLGTSLRSLGQFARSIETLKRATEVAPSDAPTWHQLGLSYLGQGSKPEAIAAFQKSVALDADLAEAHNSLGGLWLENGDLSRAEPALREAIRLQPDYAEARSNLGNLLAATNRFAEARFHFEAALRSRPRFTTARFNYGVALARAQRLDEAQHQIEELLRIDRQSAPAHDLLGNLFAARGKTSSALDQYKEAIRLEPGFGRAHLDLGSLLVDLGDIPGALPHLRKASESPQQAVKDEALEILLQIGNRRR